MEYKLEIGRHMPTDEHLNNMAEQGWQLHSIHQKNGSTYVYFEKKKP